MSFSKSVHRQILLAALLIVVITASGCTGTESEQSMSPIPVIGSNSPDKATGVVESPSPSSSPTNAEPVDTPTINPSPTFAEEPTTVPPTEEILPTETATKIPEDLALLSGGIQIYPVPAIYEGDAVSIQINPSMPSRLAPNDVDVSILIDGEQLLTANLNWRNLNGDASGLYQWVWDTDQLAGQHTLSAVVDPEDKIHFGDENPDNNRAEFTFEVLPRTALNELEAEASWISAVNDCCNIHVVSGTAAHRDLDYLIDQVDQAFSQASTVLDQPLKDRYEVFLIDRVIGQGGYASDSMVVSYLDRDYAGSGIYEVLVHEASHLLDREFAPDRISFLSEGLAVWATGGHYQQENIDQKMAGVIEGGLYVPIETIADSIYSIQHEISYLEAASFVSFLVESYGWDRVRAFYADTGADDAPTLSEAVDKNLQIHFEKSFEHLESDWMTYLSELPRDRTAVTNLRTTIRYYDVMREYQQNFDPSAYYLYAWLPPPREAEERQITADLTRHPETAANIALETILLSAKEALVEGEYRLANAYLDTVERVLANDGRFLDPLADSYLNIVRAARSSGYEVQYINMAGDQADILAVKPGEVELVKLTLELVDSGTWALMH